MSQVFCCELCFKKQLSAEHLWSTVAEYFQENFVIKQLGPVVLVEKAHI